MTVSNLGKDMYVRKAAFSNNLNNTPVSSPETQKNTSLFPYDTLPDPDCGSKAAIWSSNIYC